MNAGHILVVDDEPDIRALVQEILEDEGYQVSTAEDAASARVARRQRRPDVVLLDIWMPGTDGISLLKEWAEAGGNTTPVVMMSGHGTIETAVEATRLGAYDFIEKPLTMAKLLLAVHHALEAATLRRENIDLRRGDARIAEPVGRSAAMQALREQARRIAAHDTPMLISGEPGCGKEVVARFVHAHSARRGRPFVRVPAAALANSNSAAELFGGEEGDRVHFGSLEQANGGTLFLEDVVDMEMGVQARLLSALEHGSFLRVDGVAPVRLDLRIIAATSRDAVTAVRRGRLREDLYYLLSVVPLKVPPLRERSEDVPELIESTVNLLVERDHLPYRQFSTAALNRLRNHPWSGNMRELQNVVQRLLILGTSEDIAIEEIDIALGTPAMHDEDRGETRPAEFELPIKEARERFERAYLEHHLRAAAGSMTRVAERTGLERTHLYRKLRALGVDPKRARTTASATAPTEDQG